MTAESWGPPARPERAIEAVVFDAYGTLLDVHSAVMRHAARVGPQALAFSQEWRVKQLEYSWVRSLTDRGSPHGHHADFWTCTQEALRYVASRFGLRDEALLQDLLDAYRKLDAYPEVPAMLRALRAQGMRSAILSNGAPLMLVDATQAAGIATLLDALLSVEAVGVFKPDRRVYALAEERLGLPASRMFFVSANPWDTQAALAAGFHAIRINRNNAPDEYGLEAAGVPSLPDLSTLPGLVS